MRNATVLNVHFNTTSSSLRQNGVLKGSDLNLGPNFLDGFTLGNRMSADHPLNGRIYSFVGVNRTLDLEEINTVETYLAAKSGVTLATSPIE